MNFENRPQRTVPSADGRPMSRKPREGKVKCAKVALRIAITTDYRNQHLKAFPSLENVRKNSSVSVSSSHSSGSEKVIIGLEFADEC
jgi:hypothetical protein